MSSLISLKINEKNRMSSATVFLSALRVKMVTHLDAVVQTNKVSFRFVVKPTFVLCHTESDYSICSKQWDALTLNPCLAE